MRHVMIKFKWAALWSKCNMLDGLTEHFCLYDWKDRARGLQLFDTKKACKAYITREFGYIARRADLQAEPHCWRVPKPVRVYVQIGEISARRKSKHTIDTLRARRREKRQRASKG